MLNLICLFREGEADMKNKYPITLLVLCIVILSIIVSIYGIFSNDGTGEYQITSFRGEEITIYGKGIYQNDSIALVSQGIPQDIVTLIVGVPLLLISLIFARKGLLKGRLLLTGTLGYFLYTYISYTFLLMYNSFFLIYVALMSASFFAFVLAMLSIDIKELKSSFNPQLPVKLIGGFQIFIGVALLFLWLGRIVPSLINKTIPFGLEHYTTLVIQAMDLGFIVPTAILSGILIIYRSPFGYLLSSVVIIKGITMLTAISAMIIGMAYAGVEMSPIEMALFPMFNLVIIYILYILLKNIDEKKHGSEISLN